MRTAISYLILLAVVAALCMLPFVAFAAEATDAVAAAPTLADLAEQLYASVTAGQIDWVVTVSIALLLVIAALRKAAKSDATGRVGDWLEDVLYGSDLRGTASTLVLSFVGALATAGAAGAPMSWPAVKAALIVGAAAAGGYSVLWRRLALPLLRKVPVVGDMLPAAPDEAK